MSTMRAVAIVEPRCARIVEVPIPTPAADEVLIRLEGCGLCGSNLPAWQGRPWFRYPLDPGAPGHEGWGRIAHMGPRAAERADAAGLRVGDRVAALSQRAFAEWDVAQLDALVRLPDTLDGQPVPGEALGCAVNVVRRAQLEPSQRVAVIGVGFLGALVIQLAARAGAEVMALSRRPFALAVAERMGASVTMPLTDDDAPILAAVQTWTDQAGCDRVIEAAGHARTLELAAKLTRVRGRLVIAGYHQDGPRQVDMQLWNWRGLDVINAHERDPAVYVAGMRAAIEAIAAGHLDPSPLYTHAVGLDQAAEAFAALDARPNGFMKAQVLA